MKLRHLLTAAEVRAARTDGTHPAAGRTARLIARNPRHLPVASERIVRPRPVVLRVQPQLPEAQLGGRSETGYPALRVRRPPFCRGCGRHVGHGQSAIMFDFFVHGDADLMPRRAFLHLDPLDCLAGAGADTGAEGAGR